MAATCEILYGTALDAAHATGTIPYFRKDFLAGCRDSIKNKTDLSYAKWSAHQH